MQPLLVFNPKEIEPIDYVDRKTAKAIIVNDNDEVFSFKSNLIGGGVDGDETYEEALHREALEEAGITIEIGKYLGEVIAYRDALKKKYIIKGYVCRYVAKVAEPVDELHHVPEWRKHKDFVLQLENDINEIKKEGVIDGNFDLFETRIGNSEMMACFLKEAFKE